MLKRGGSHMEFKRLLRRQTRWLCLGSDTRWWYG